MKIIMTGATGYIGAKLVKRLSAKGHQIYAVVRKESDTTIIENDVEELIQSIPYENLKNIFSKIEPEIYINLAGVYCGSHTNKNIYDLIDGNVILPTYVLDAVVDAGCKHVIHTASFQQSYNGEHYNPMNLYAATKQAFEDILYYYTSINQISAITLQLFDTYGADDTRRKVFNLVRKLQNGDSIEMSPGLQKLYFCYIDDVIEAYCRAMSLAKEKSLGYNARYAVRGEQPIALREFVEAYIEQSQKNISIQWGKREYMAKEIMDPSGIGEILPGWSPKVSYVQGMKLCCDYDTK